MAGTAEGARPGAGRRVAAGVALLAALGAIALVIVALLQEPLRLVAAPVLVGVAVAAGWTALVRRGAWRIVACAIALLALVGVVLLVVTASVLRTAGVVVLVLVAASLARVALGRDLLPAPSGLKSVPPAGHGVLLMNPRSGGGKVGRFGLEEEALRRGVTPVVLEPGDDLRALAEAAVAEGADVLGMAGGDGSQALVADVARQHDVPLVVIPAGTRNHFALDLGLDREDVVAALDAFGPALERRIDLAVLGDRVFVNNASLGVYAGVVQSEGYRDAKLATTARMAPDLLGPGAEGSHLRFRGPDGDLGGPTAMVLVSNGDYRLDRLDGFGTRARLDGGVLGVVTLRVEKGRDVTEMLAAQATGRLRSFHGYRQWSAPEFEVDSDKPLVEVGVDGEALRLPPPLRFRVLPGALRVRVPVGSPGAAPAAVAPAGPGEAIAGLLRVLRGQPAVRRQA
ncbi:diacylglycerol kinase [Pseudonocardia kujensis]|uniref:diacylglycerol/lipid kinase family protein n=1 Tax=Pseudonocardia kujensis TaxID=1128675 RepID=UPI001E387176|nr:diacylglycerol kinase family protein [Pseudonocardia kujensis]MCE0761514.1 diacylglycerol kinase [Pseudonocardia kujensis]